jgi:hypothetical protein
LYQLHLMTSDTSQNTQHIIWHYILSSNYSCHGGFSVSCTDITYYKVLCQLT